MAFDRIGWWLFLGSSGLFTTSSLKSGDVTALLGSLLFLVGCVVFMRPKKCSALADQANGSFE